MTPEEIARARAGLIFSRELRRREDALAARLVNELQGECRDARMWSLVGALAEMRSVRSELERLSANLKDT